ncbi:MAG TPA: Lrp/AsnC family transcriptional regulator [Conexibacter sp.]|nr:Lrp/AsnC family transcriptional regulator [Conexibacter sp.]
MPRAKRQNPAEPARDGAIDATDLEIIAELQEDGRRTYGRIGQQVGLSEAAVRQRVQRLVDSEAIKIVAVTDPERFGVRVRATIAVSVDGDVEPVAEALAQIPQVDYVVAVAGPFDVLVEVQCSDEADLFAVINRGIRQIDGVAGTETWPYLRLYKQTYPWPPN